MVVVVVVQPRARRRRCAKADVVSADVGGVEEILETRAACFWNLARLAAGRTLTG